MVENDYQTVKTALLTALAEWPHMSRPRERAFNIALDALERMQAESNASRKEASRVAADLIGYPGDDADAQSIAEATPVQAIRALEDVLSKFKQMPDRPCVCGHPDNFNCEAM